MINKILKIIMIKNLILYKKNLIIEEERRELAYRKGNPPNHKLRL